jgi:serine/threonine-protein kinase
MEQRHTEPWVGGPPRCARDARFAGGARAVRRPGRTYSVERVAAHPREWGAQGADEPGDERARARRASRDGDYVDPLLGCVVNGTYRVVSSVASGAMGKIYRAEQQPLGRPVALKVLHARHMRGSDAPALKRRFFLEASTLSKLQHPTS